MERSVAATRSEHFLAALAAGGWATDPSGRAQCPGPRHDEFLDDKFSLTVTERANGEVLLLCADGCKEAAIRERLGLASETVSAGRSVNSSRAPTQASKRVQAGREFQRDQNGKLLASQSNIRLAVREFGHTLRHDTFANRLLVDDVHMDDAAVNRLRLKAEEEFKLSVQKQRWFDVIENEAR